MPVTEGATRVPPAPHVTRFARGGLRRALAVAGALTVALVLAPVSGANAAVPESVDLAFSVENLTPGSVGSDTQVYTLERAAQLTDVEWTHRSGVLASADLSLELCDADNRCGTAGELIGTGFSPGPITVTLTVRVADDVAHSTRGTAAGRLVFVADDAPLATTGVDPTRTILWAAALLLSGAALVALTAHRRHPARTSAPHPPDARATER